MCGCPTDSCLSTTTDESRRSDPEFLPLPVDPNPALTPASSEVPGAWQIARLEDEVELTFTKSEFDADLTRRMATIYLRRAASG
jgi:hypothetical protein